MNEKLSPELIALRDLFLRLAEGKTDKERYSWIQENLENETDDLRRLALMSARVSILRSRSIGKDEQKKEKKVAIKKVKEKKVQPKNPIEEEQWYRLRMMKSAEVNGIRFPSGVIVDVKSKDGKKLLSKGIAEIVNLEDLNNKPDTSQNGKITKDT